MLCAGEMLYYQALMSKLTRREFMSVSAAVGLAISRCGGASEFSAR